MGITTQPQVLFPESVPARLQLTLQRFTSNVRVDLGDAEDDVEAVEEIAARKGDVPGSSASAGQKNEWSLYNRLDLGAFAYWHDGTRWGRLGLWGNAAYTQRAEGARVEEDTAQANLALLNLPQKGEPGWVFKGYVTEYWIYTVISFVWYWYQFGSAVHRQTWRWTYPWLAEDWTDYDIQREVWVWE